MPAIFQLRIAKKINKALSVRVKVVCSDHKLLWWDSYKGVGRASTLPDAAQDYYYYFLPIYSVMQNYFYLQEHFLYC